MVAQSVSALVPRRLSYSRALLSLDNHLAQETVGILDTESVRKSNETNVRLSGGVGPVGSAVVGATVVVVLVRRRRQLNQGCTIIAVLSDQFHLITFSY